MAPRRDKAQPAKYWHCSLIGGKRARYLGFVRRATRAEAEVAAVKEFALSVEQRRRLVVREEKAS